jgi:hypothetical protein
MTGGHKLCQEYVREHSGLDASLIVCGRPAVAHGWCAGHYDRNRSGRPMDHYVRGSTMHRTCDELVRESWEPEAALVRCGRPAKHRNNWCPMHFQRLQAGVPMERPSKIKTRRGPKEIKHRDEYGHKQCSTCKQFLPELEFPPRMHRCQLCTNLHKYGLDRNKIEDLLNSQGGYCANPGCNAILQIRCAGRGRKQSRRGEGLSLACVDHDHNCCPGNIKVTCGKCVRGLLCWHCNAGAGLLGDDPKKAQGLAEYLSRSMQMAGV